MNTAQGSLTVLNAHTLTPTIYWNGQEVVGVKRIHIHNDEDEARVKLVVTGNQDQLYAEMIIAGITVKKVTV